MNKDTISQLANLVIEQAKEHQFPVEVDAIRGAIEQFAKFNNIAASEDEIVAACKETERLASDITIEAELFNQDDADAKFETVQFNALDVLKYHEESRTWGELTLDTTAQHLQRSLAEDYALHEFRRKHGDNASYEVNITSGLGIGFEQDEDQTLHDHP